MSNPPTDKQEQVFLEEQFRNVFFSKRPDPKRLRIPPPDAAAKKKRKASLTNRSVALLVKTTATKANSIPTKAPKYIRRFRLRSLPIILYTRQPGSGGAAAAAAAAAAVAGTNGAAAATPLSATLPPSDAARGVSSSVAAALSAARRPHHALELHPHAHFSAPPLLPPINLLLLKEIDLHEILKNPQLRHDILFDPQLQFRPNLDGERGKRKKSIIDNYWSEIEKECQAIFVLRNFAVKHLRIPLLFVTLRDILLLLLPYKDRASVNDIMDMDLLVQQLAVGAFDFVLLANWLGKIFKCHCAPMRDNWVTEMVTKFAQANAQNSVEKLVCGLRMIFLILEAMKLDVANHQIRILRPVLIETAVEFEKDYFSQLIGHHKLDIADLLKWFAAAAGATAAGAGASKAAMRASLTLAILGLLLCRKMVNEFPLTLAFDHTRLILLRADIRQLVCIQLCVVLYKQLVFNNAAEMSAAAKAAALLTDTISRVQEEVLSIVTDDNGTIKWTRNVRAILLQLVRNAYGASHLSQPMVDFLYSWLMKQIQPTSQVYGLMEEKIFKELAAEIALQLAASGGATGAPAAALSATALSAKAAAAASAAPLGALSAKKLAAILLATPKSGGGGVAGLHGRKAVAAVPASRSSSEMGNIANRIATLVKFHWNVFGPYYIEHCAQAPSA
jgi:hypothetical protein